MKPGNLLMQGAKSGGANRKMRQNSLWALRGSGTLFLCGKRLITMKRIFTSESVTEGHPDKICDQISDGVLDAILARDPMARVACETITTTGMVFVMGEISTNCYVDIPGIARDVICRIGYDHPEYGFDGRTCSVMTAIDGQSPDIAMGVDRAYDEEDEIGAGDQVNTPKDTWTEFFTECRLIPQFERAAAYFGGGERKAIDAFLNRVDRYLAEPERPSLLHGDLWGGNYMIDVQGHPWLIDPAVYVGHAEADLAMTELFGGFDRTFYDAYRSTAGIDPYYRDRKDLYNLYHLLNHLNLFGGGYLYSVKSVISRYV